MGEVFEYSGVTVRYKLRHAKQDRKHLVVVFAGVQAGKHDFFGFDGSALDNVKGAVLWIKDSFEDNNAYYLCAGLDFKIERAVAALIDSTLQMLELDAADCTLLGGSKGGSAALHLGLKYDYKNIVASVPQTKIGTYTRQRLKETFAFMAGTDADMAESMLDNYIPDLIASPRSHAKNIYIISSEADPEFEMQIRPWLNSLAKFRNFNILISDSTLVTCHPEVTPYNIPFILSTLYALCEGLAPRFGVVRNGNGKRDRERSSMHSQVSEQTGLAIAGFHWVQVRASVLKFRAYGAVLGEGAPEPPTEQPMLLALRGVERHEFCLESRNDKSLNSKLYNEYYCDYSWAGLGTPDDRGLSLEELPSGEFDLLASFAARSGHRNASLIAKTTRATGFSSGYLYQLDAGPEGTRLRKTSLDGCVPADGVFEYSTVEIQDSKLFISGSFAVPREEMRRWNEGDFALTLSNSSTTTSYQLAASRVRCHTERPTILDAEEHTWSNFATPSNSGFALGPLPDGRYDGYVSFVRNGRVHTSDERFMLVVDAGKQQVERSTNMSTI